MTVVKVKTEAEFDSFIAKSKENNSLVMIDFSAVWCGPCQMISPHFEKLSQEYPAITFLKVDVDEVSSVARKCGISAMPTFHIYKGGEKVGEVVGADINSVKQLITSNT